MKKIVSLFLACLMVLSIGIIPAFATTETELYADKEAALTEGALTATASNGNFAATNFAEPTNAMLEQDFWGKLNSTTGVEVKKDGDNVYFELDGYNTRNDHYWSHKLYIYDYNATSNSTKVKKYSAMVSLPSVTEGATNLFGQQDGKDGDATMFNVKAEKQFGVHLANGGAYYWDAATQAYVNFVADGTMQANKYYRVEAIMDARARTVSATSAPLYMRAFVYDGDTLLGETGWVHPTNYGYQYYLTGRVTIIEAYGYPEDNCAVKVDEFKGYKLDNFPTYSIADGYATIASNKYVAATSLHTWYRTFGEKFNAGTAKDFISTTSAYKAARYEMSFRIPTFGSKFNFMGFLADQNMKNGNSETVGMASVSSTGAFSAVDASGAAATLTGEGVTNNTYQLAVDTWYDLAIEVDYSTYATPSAKLTLKDQATGTTLAECANYTVKQMEIKTGNGYNHSVIMWAYVGTTNASVHFDNTEIYVAADATALANGTDVVTVVSDDFEVYEGENAALYADGAIYKDVTGKHGVNATGATNQGKGDSTGAVMATEVFAQQPDFEFEDGMTFPATEATKLRFTYSNDVPNANINYNNIKLASGDVEFVGGVDYVVEAGNDGDIADTSKSFTIEMPVFIGGTNYAVRLMAGLSDYNTSATISNALMGVPADNGFYKDITFNTNGDAKETSVASNLVDASGATATSLTVGEVIEGKVIVANGGADAINGNVILGIYDGDELVTALISENAFSAAAGATISASTPAYTVAKDGLKAKIFVWKDLTSLQPIIAAEVVPAA